MKTKQASFVISWYFCQEFIYFNFYWSKVISSNMVGKTCICAYTLYCMLWITKDTAAMLIHSNKNYNLQYNNELQKELSETQWMLVSRPVVCANWLLLLIVCIPSYPHYNVVQSTTEGRQVLSIVWEKNGWGALFWSVGLENSKVNMYKSDFCGQNASSFFCLVAKFQKLP